MSDSNETHQNSIGKIEELNRSLSDKIRTLEEQRSKQDEMEQFFTSVFHSMTEGVIVIDEQERILLFNHAAEMLTGYSQKDVLGKAYNEIFGRHFSERFTPVYTLKSGESLLHQEKEIKTKFGQTLSVRFSTSPMYDAENKMTGVVEVMTDLTRLKQMETVVQQIKIQAALAQMAGLIAHEIRNPLGGILGNIDMMKQMHTDSGINTESLDAIRTSVAQIDKIISRFQRFAKPVTPQFQTLDLISYLQEVLDLFVQNHAINHPYIHFNFRFPDSVETLQWSIDPVLLEQVLFDILDNGVKAISGEGTITLKLERNPKGHRNDSVVISVADTGSGMDQKVLDNLFIPFYTTRAKGMGLSLAIARHFIYLHRGEVKVESGIGRGTVFKIFLPR